MQEVEPRWTVAVVVCGNERPPEHPRGSCGAEAATELRHWLRDRARAEGIRASIVVHRGNCMNTCGKGTSVSIHGGKREVYAVGVDDREALWKKIAAAVDSERSV